MFFGTSSWTAGNASLPRLSGDDRIRFLNIRNCITNLHRCECIPIINENDTVAVEELEALRVGENDLLAAMICNALPADVLVLLTNVEGLQDERGRRIDLVDSISHRRISLTADIWP